MTRGDWYVIEFYRLVSDQTNSNGLPSFPGYKVALDAHGYPAYLHGWLLQTAGLLHRLLNKQEFVNWLGECKKGFRFITREDVTDD